MKKTFIIITAVCAGLAACTARVLAPTSEQLSVMQQKLPGITLERAQEGYRLYSAKCAACHQLYPPGKFTVNQWDKILARMFPKAKLTDGQQQQLIRDYVHALSR